MDGPPVVALILAFSGQQRLRPRPMVTVSGEALIMKAHQADVLGLQFLLTMPFPVLSPGCRHPGL